MEARKESGPFTRWLRRWPAIRTPKAVPSASDRILGLKLENAILRREVDELRPQLLRQRAEIDELQRNLAAGAGLLVEANKDKRALQDKINMLTSQLRKAQMGQ